MTQRAGDVLVSVHTPDVALQTSLRQDLPELVNALDRAGFDGQTFFPRAAALAESSLEAGTGGSSADSRGATPDSRSGNANSGTFSQPSFSQQHESRDRQAQRWLDQIEE